MLTSTQIANIHKLDAQTCTQILHECVERLGLVTAKEYSEINCIPMRTVYQMYNDGLIDSITISERIYLIINDK
jgi:hypothetical protein